MKEISKKYQILLDWMTQLTKLVDLKPYVCRHRIEYILGIVAADGGGNDEDRSLNIALQFLISKKAKGLITLQIFLKVGGIITDREKWIEQVIEISDRYVQVSF